MVQVTPAADGALVVAENGSITKRSHKSSQSEGGSVIEQEETPEQREQWGSMVDFILSCVGYAVGFGNLTRFPYICGRNGGAAFLIPYLIMMVFTGLPVFFLELSIGQFSQVTPQMLYRRMSPIFRGLGPAMVIVAAFTCIYYNLQMAWSLIYLWDSIYYPISGVELPFKGCQHEFNTARCFDVDMVNDCDWTFYNETNYPIWNHTFPPQTYRFGHCVNTSTLTDPNEPFEFWNATLNITRMDWGRMPAKEYNEHMLGYLGTNDTMAMQHFGNPRWQLVVALAVAWLLIFLMLFGGVHISGKIVWFTATFPYVCMLVLLIVGNTMQNSFDGVKFYMVPHFDKLAKVQRILFGRFCLEKIYKNNPSLLSPTWFLLAGLASAMYPEEIFGLLKPWSDAATQIFFSIGVGSGGLTTLATYNKFHNNLLRDTILVVLGNCATSLFCGFVIFPILGFEAGRIYPNMDPYDRVAKIAGSGPSLAFIAYPGALAEIPLPWLWSIIFFFMLLLLGIDSENVMVEVVITAFLDRYPILRQKYKALTTLGICLFFFAAGLIFTTPVGIELYTIVDVFAGGWTLTIAGMCEVIMIAWVYDIRRFIADLRLMLGVPKTKLWKILGYPVNPYWIACWTVITPLLLIAINIASFIGYDLTYQNKEFPGWAEALGFCVTGICVIWIPLGMLVQLYQMCTMSKSWKWLITPTSHWGPSHVEDRKELETYHPYHKNIDPLFESGTLRTKVDPILGGGTIKPLEKY